MFPLRLKGAGPVDSFLRSWFGKMYRPRVVVLGNLKGGSGKSTAAIHLSVSLMKCVRVAWEPSRSILPTE